MKATFRRHTVLEELPFVDKQCLSGLALRPGIPYAMRVTFHGTEYDVVVGWVSKGRSKCVMFRCPLSGRMVERLYPWHGWLVARQVTGLRYASQVRGQLDVLEYQADRIRQSLQDPLFFVPLSEGATTPYRPKTMRWGTYWAKVEKLEALQHAFMQLAHRKGYLSCETGLTF